MRITPSTPGDAHVLVAFGVFDTDGSSITAHGCTCAHNGNGDYTITFDPTFKTGTIPVVMLTVHVGAALGRTTQVNDAVTALSNSSCRLNVRDLLVAAVNTKFHFFAIGVA